MIEKEVFRFYSNLYSCEFSPADSNSFFAQTEQFQPVMDDTFREFDDSDLLLEVLSVMVCR